MKKIKIISMLLMVLSIQSLVAQGQEKAYFSKTVEGTFEEIAEKVTEYLIEQGFGIVTEIDLDVRIKNKIGDADMKPYKILGPCNAELAYEAHKVEENIGFILPCRVIVKDLGNNKVEILMENPTEKLIVRDNIELNKIADQVKTKYLSVLKSL